MKHWEIEDFEATLTVRKLGMMAVQRNEPRRMGF